MFRLKNVLVTDPVHPSCVQILKENDIGVEYKPKMPVEDILREIQNFDGLIVRSGTQVTASILEAGNKLKIVGRAGTGVDNIDCTAATHKGIVVMNTPGGNTISAVEHTCAMILSLFRDIPRACASLKSGSWERSKFMGNELQGKTLAIIGLGRIGREVALRMQAFDVTTIGFDPIIPPEVTKEFGVESMSLDELWPLADIVTIHTPLIPETKYLVNEEMLKRCKSGIRIINVARGGIVDESALLKALEDGHCGGAALDVFEEEPPLNSPLLQHPKVICTPHLGASTAEAQSRVALEIAEQFVNFSKSHSAVGLVNAPMLSLAMQLENQPWIRLSKCLGKLAAGMISTNQPEKVNITLLLKGRLQRLSELLSSAILIGNMEQINKNGINFINAHLIAEKQGFVITSKIESSQAGDDENMLRVKTEFNGECFTLVGTLRGDIPVLHSINGVAFHDDIPLSRRILLFRSDNLVSSKDVMGLLENENLTCSAIYCSTFWTPQWIVVKINETKAEVGVIQNKVADVTFEG